ncbi:MAG: LysR family transcriptional regulator [Propylenella sp.]
MDIRQLQYFLKVAERRSITAAASELNITQPTLTKSIRLLEQELGVTLFDRLPRGVELTLYGQSLVRHAQAVQVQLDDAVGELNGLRGGAEGQVLIGAGPAWLRRHLPLAVARTLSGRPRLKVRIFGGFDEALLRALRHGDLDFVVAELPGTETESDLKIVPLTSDTLDVACRTSHPLARQKKIDLKALLAFPWVLPANNPRARRKLEALFLARDIPPPIPVVETESMAFVFAMLRDSDALTYTTANTVSGPGGFGLTSLNVAALRSRRDAGIMQRRGAWLSPGAQSVIEELKAICTEWPEN